MRAARPLLRLTALGAMLGATIMLGAGRPADARSTAVAGPSWISIETPVNPYDRTTRGAFLLVHAFRHGTPVAMPVTGTAEGFVNGERRSVALEFTPTSRSGAFALRKQWGNAGLWTLVITVAPHETNAAQALVEIGANGEVSRVQVPTRAGERADMPFPRQVTAQEVDSALRLRSRTAVAQTGRM